MYASQNDCLGDEGGATWTNCFATFNPKSWANASTILLDLTWLINKTLWYQTYLETAFKLESFSVWLIRLLEWSLKMILANSKNVSCTMEQILTMQGGGEYKGKERYLRKRVRNSWALEVAMGVLVRWCKVVCEREIPILIEKLWDGKTSFDYLLYSISRV